MRCNNTSYHRMTRGWSRARARSFPIYSAVFIRAVRAYLRDGLLAYRYGCACVPAISEGEARNTALLVWMGNVKKEGLARPNWRLSSVFTMQNQPLRLSASMSILGNGRRPGNKGNGFPSTKAKMWKKYHIKFGLKCSKMVRHEGPRKSCNWTLTKMVEMFSVV